MYWQSLYLNCLPFVFARAFSKALGNGHMSFLYIKVVTYHFVIFIGPLVFCHLFQKYSKQSFSNIFTSFWNYTICSQKINQVLFDFFSEFDKGNEICVVFLDLSKAFDKVWHKGLLYKLGRYSVNESFLNLMASYLGVREQRVIMQNAESTWRPITAGVPQGSVLGPLLFLLYINDLGDDIESVIYLFADDCSLFQKIDKNYHKYVNTLNIKVVQRLAFYS